MFDMVPAASTEFGLHSENKNSIPQSEEWVRIGLLIIRSITVLVNFYIHHVQQKYGLQIIRKFKKIHFTTLAWMSLFLTHIYKIN
jgi:hypothetical protein